MNKMIKLPLFLGICGAACGAILAGVYAFTNPIIEETAAKKAAERMINQEYIKTPGAFILNINGEFKYGNINTQQTPEWKDYFFE